MEDWAFDKILDNIYKYGSRTREKIIDLKLEDGTTPKGQKARYVELFPCIIEHRTLTNVTCSSLYTTVEKDESGKISSVKVWFKKDIDELLEVKELPEEYDSSKKIWGFYSKIYKDDIKGIAGVPTTQEVRSCNKKKYIRCYKTLDGITFGGEVDFNFNKSKVDYLEGTVNNDPLFRDKENIKKEIIKLIIEASKHHHSIENVSMMATTGNMQGTKQNIGDDRFDVFVYAIDEYCKGNTAWLLAHCTPENKKVLCDFIKRICSKDGQLCSDEYYRKVYKITDKKLIDDLKRSGKLSIDSAERVLEYISLAYRVWIHRAKHYENKYKKKYKELNGFFSEKLIEEYKKVVGAIQKL